MIEEGLSPLSSSDPAPAVQHSNSDRNPLLFDPRELFSEAALDAGRLPLGGGDFTYSGSIFFLPSTAAKLLSYPFQARTSVVIHLFFCCYSFSAGQI